MLENFGGTLSVGDEGQGGIANSDIIFLKVALLRYNQYTTLFTHLMHMIQRFLVCSQL